MEVNAYRIFPKADGSRERQRAVERQGGAEAGPPPEHLCRRRSEKKDEVIGHETLIYG